MDQGLAAKERREFFSIIDEVDAGSWRASAAVRVTKRDEIQEENLGIEMFSSEQAAFAWLNEEARSRGFLKFQVIVKRLADGAM